MDRVAILEIFGKKVMDNDLPAALIEAHKEISFTIFEEVIKENPQPAQTDKSWKILKDIAGARSTLVPFLSFAEKAEGLLVNPENYIELDYIFKKFKTSVQYVIANYDALGQYSNLHELWTKEKMGQALNAITEASAIFSNEIVEEGQANVSSDTLKLTSRMFSLTLYAIMGEKNYYKFAAESKKAMKILSDYQRHFTEPGETRIQ